MAESIDYRQGNNDPGSHRVYSRGPHLCNTQYARLYSLYRNSAGAHIVSRGSCSVLSHMILRIN